MKKTTSHQGSKSQIDKFKEAARELECDDDKETFDKRLSKLVKSAVSGDKSEK